MHHELLFQFGIIYEIIKPVHTLYDALNSTSAHGKLLPTQDSTAQHRYVDIHIERDSGTTPRVLYLGTRLRRVVIFTLQSAYYRQKSTCCPLNRGMCMNVIAEKIPDPAGKPPQVIQGVADTVRTELSARDRAVIH
jgi:hypothetical protein